MDMSMQGVTDKVSRDDDVSDDDSCSPESDCSGLSNDSEGSLVDADDLPLLEYARSHGLCTDYRSVNPLALDVLGHFQPDSIVDHGGLDQLCLPDNLDLDEKLCLNIGSAVLLREIVTAANDENVEQAVTSQSRKTFRADSPLLLTDARLEFRLFNRKVRVGHALDPSRFLPFEDSDKLDTGLEWLDPVTMVTTFAEASSEKLQLTQKDIFFLHMVSPERLSNREDQIVITYEPETPRTVYPQHETPPLLPVDSSYSPDAPESPVGHLQLASDPFDPTPDELNELHELILKEDGLLSPQATMTEPPYDSVIYLEDYSHIVPSFENAAHGSSSPAIKRPRVEDFKEEVPLSPAADLPSPLKKAKTVTFSEVLATAIPEYAKAFSPEYFEAVDGDDDEFFDKMIQPIAEATISAVEHEQLSEAGSLLRVEVPMVDHSIPALPWDSFKSDRAVSATIKQGELDCQKGLLSVIKRTLLHKEKLWLENLDQGVMSWTPFPSHLGKIVTKEELNDGALERYLAKLSFKEIDVTVWKSEGLRVLDVREDDDHELEEISFATIPNFKPIMEDMQTLIKRRQQELNNRKEDYIEGDRARAPLIKATTTGGQPTNNPSNTDTLIGTHTTLGGAFSASTSLGRFMQVQTGVNPKFNPPRPKLEETRAMRELDIVTPQMLEDKAVHGQRVPANATSSLTVPVPKFNAALAASPRHFVLSSTLFKHRTIIKSIEKEYPMAHLIERDFETDAVISKDGAQASMYEADLLLSPGTGMILSTLQHIKQMPLPGQVSHAGIRDRIRSLVPRYERLIVLVSEGQPLSPTNVAITNPPQALDGRDCTALSSLTSFAATHVDADVQIVWVPGGEETLATWTISCMIKYGIDDPEIQLVSDETLWEVVLRRAGMNAFAAQAILVTLKEPSEDSIKLRSAVEGTEFGLAAFIQMRPEERKRDFSSIMGGERLLDRVGKVIDGMWTSGAALHSRR